MKKQVLIIGNDDGLPGVKKDIDNYRNFFKSPFGGAWLDPEINVKLNTSKSEIINEIQRLKFLTLDYLIVIFSGHGGQKRETVLELNHNGELMNESDLKYISVRQLNIFDCCRSFPQQLFEAYESKTVSETITDILVRPKFEKRILQAINQQVSLYACSIGETAIDTLEGGVYSRFLIQSAKQIEDQFKLVGGAHQEASLLTTQLITSQHPDAILPRCLSEQQLIIGINPSI